MKTTHTCLLIIIDFLTVFIPTMFWNELAYNHALKELSIDIILISLLLWLSHIWLLSPGLTSNVIHRFILLTEKNSHNSSSLLMTVFTQITDNVVSFLCVALLGGKFLYKIQLKVQWTVLWMPYQSYLLFSGDIN